jgi:hypothetical protein
MDIHIAPLRQDFLIKIRQYGLDDQNQPVERLVAEGGEPCRDVLRRAYPGEALILASYCPFSLPGPYKEYGPIFTLAEPSTEVVKLDRLPLQNGSAADYLRDHFVLRAYDEYERIVDSVLSTPERCEADLERMLDDKRVRFVLVRFAAYGCYAFRIEGRHWS